MIKKKINIKSIKNLKKLSGKKVLLRVDFNVPIEKNEIKNDFKIKASLETINFLLSKNAKIIIISHLGRPDKTNLSKYTLKPIAKKLEDLLGLKIKFFNDCIGREVANQIDKLKKTEILMLENLRFYQEEENNNNFFAAQLASLADIYVNDAFGVCHRKHASVDKIKKHIPSYAGLLLEKEFKNLNKIFYHEKPLIVIIGGAKLKTKIPLIRRLEPFADKILVGGVLANNFLLARGFEVGKSMVSLDSLDFAKKFQSKKLILPIDVLVGANKEEKFRGKVKKITKVQKVDCILDIGPNTVNLFSNFIKKSKTIVWNGPMGLFEDKDFNGGTMAIAYSVAKNAKGKTFAVVGGGETVEAVQQAKVDNQIDWISTGGGAMLAFLSGKKMPGFKKIIKL